MQSAPCPQYYTFFSSWTSSLTAAQGIHWVPAVLDSCYEHQASSYLGIFSLLIPLPEMLCLQIVTHLPPSAIPFTPSNFYQLVPTLNHPSLFLLYILSLIVYFGLTSCMFLIYPAYYILSPLLGCKLECNKNMRLRILVCFVCCSISST